MLCNGLNVLCNGLNVLCNGLNVLCNGLNVLCNGLNIAEKMKCNVIHFSVFDSWSAHSDNKFVPLFLFEAVS